MITLRSFLIIYVVILGLVVSGCGQTPNQNNKGDREYSMLGYAVKKDRNKILLVSSTPNRNGQYSAVWVKTKSEVMIGEKIEVFFKGEEILATNPGQAEAKRIDILIFETSGNPHKEANEILQEVLLENTDMEIPIIEKFEFIPNEKRWSIVIYDDKDPLNKKEYLIND